MATPAGYFRIRLPGQAWLAPDLGTFPQPNNRTPNIIDAEPTDRNGDGKPVGAFGPSEGSIKWKAMQAATDYKALVDLFDNAAAGDAGVDIEIELRNKRNELWAVYTGVLGWPRSDHPQQLPDGTNWYYNVECTLYALRLAP